MLMTALLVALVVLLVLLLLVPQHASALMYAAGLIGAALALIWLQDAGWWPDGSGRPYR